jgi:hypothetical protein
MKIKTIKLFTFDELSDEAKAKSIEANRYIHTEDLKWWDSVEDMFKEDMAKLGYEVEKIYFSVFNNQGDGACFEGKVSVDKWLLAHKLGKKYRALLNYCRNYGGYVTIAQQGRYYHEKSMTFAKSDTLCDYYYLDYDRLGEKVGKQIDEVMELIENESEEKARQLYKDLKAESNYLQSDEVIAQTLLTNEYNFLEEGGEIQ